MTERKERRRDRRLVQPFDARYRLYGELTESWRTIRTVNLSASGMRFRSADLMRVGDELEVALLLPAHREPIVVRGRIIWSQAMASGVAENGVEFVDVAPEQGMQIDALVKFLLQGRPAPPSS